MKFAEFRKSFAMRLKTKDIVLAMDDAGEENLNNAQRQAAGKIVASIADHDRKYHPNGYNGGKCTFREQMGAKAASLGVSSTVNSQTTGGIGTQSDKDTNVITKEQQEEEHATQPYQQFKATTEGILNGREYSDLSDDEKSNYEQAVDEYLKNGIGEAEYKAFQTLEEMAKNADPQTLQEISEVAKAVKEDPNASDAQKEAADRLERDVRAPELENFYNKGTVATINGNKMLFLNDGVANDAKTMKDINRLADYYGIKIVGKMDLNNARFNAIAENLPAGERAFVEEMRKAMGKLDAGEKASMLLDEVQSKLDASTDDKEKNELEKQKNLLTDIANKYARASGAKKNQMIDQLADIETQVRLSGLKNDPSIPPVEAPKNLAHEGEVPMDILFQEDDTSDTAKGEKYSQALAQELDAICGENMLRYDMGEPKVMHGQTEFSVNFDQGAFNRVEMMGKMRRVEKYLKDSLKSYDVSIKPDGHGYGFTVSLRHDNEDISHAEAGSLAKALGDKELIKDIDKKMAMPMCIGVDAENKPVFMDLSQGGGMILGNPGFGKSARVLAGLASMMAIKGPKGIQMFISCVKNSGDYASLKGNPCVGGIAESYADTRKMLERGMNELARRNKVVTDSGCKSLSEYNSKFPDKALPAMPMITDEINALIDAGNAGDKDAKACINMIGQLNDQGRKYGITHLSIGQHGEKKYGVTDGILGTQRFAVHMAGDKGAVSRFFGTSQGSSPTTTAKGEVAYKAENSDKISVVNGIYTPTGEDAEKAGGTEFQRMADYWEGKPIPKHGKASEASSKNDGGESKSDNEGNNGNGGSTNNGAPTPPPERNGDTSAPTYESIMQKMQNAKTDEERMNALNEMAEFMTDPARGKGKSGAETTKQENSPKATEGQTRQESTPQPPPQTPQASEANGSEGTKAEERKTETPQTTPSQTESQPKTETVTPGSEANVNGNGGTANANGGQSNEASVGNENKPTITESEYTNPPNGRYVDSGDNEVTTPNGSRWNKQRLETMFSNLNKKISDNNDNAEVIRKIDDAVQRQFGIKGYSKRLAEDKRKTDDRNLLGIDFDPL